MTERIKKYLKKFGQSEGCPNNNLSQRYNIIITIPCFNENESIPHLIESLKNCIKPKQKPLIIFVVNNATISPKEIILNNIETIKYLNNLEANNNFDITVIDAATDACAVNNKDAGVGIARKIGMDYSLNYFLNPERGLLVCLDADCIVSENYLNCLETIFDDNKIKAGYINYSHLRENMVNKDAIIAYEIFLNYYVSGLTYAESEFAFHTIGSTMFCDLDSYIKIQGMNKRKAAEDFYFLEKLSKITTIHKIECATVFPSSRQSNRVPFGTGKAVTDFSEKHESEKYLLYDFRSFFLLKKWLKIYNVSLESSKKVLEQTQLINEYIGEFLEKSGFSKFWDENVSGKTDIIQIKKQKKYWFDAFRTLKFIHFIAEKVYPKKNMFDELDKLFSETNQPKINRKQNSIPTLEIQLKYLEKLKTF